MLEQLKDYKSVILDYSIIREFGGTSTFSELVDIISENSIDVYVSKSFKLLHYCIIHQADSKDNGTNDAMRNLCTLLLPLRKLHSVQAVETNDFLKLLTSVENCCLLTTKNGVFTKRLYEKNSKVHCDICIFTSKDINIFKSMDEVKEAFPAPKASPLALKNNYLDVPFCNVGDTVMTGNNVGLELTKRISSGAEGMVFLTNNPRKVAKVYHKGIITPLRWSKLTKMVSMGIKSSGICWPQDLLFFRGVPVGYTMFIGKGKTLGNVFDGPDAITNNFPEWKRADVVSTLINLIEKYLYLHMHNIVAGDIQLKNALLYSSDSVYLIDMDSVQVGNLPCPVGTEEFTDPRLWGQNFSEFTRKLADEDYSIAMMVFSLLFCGLHPYATRKGADTLREEILEKNFPYTLDNSDDEHIPKGGYNYIWEYTPDYLREMLYNTFKLGKVYEAIEWYDAVLRYKDELVGNKFEDPEAYKVFPKMNYKVTDATESISGDRLSVAPGADKRFSGIKNKIYTVDDNNPFAKVANSSPAPLGGTYSAPARPNNVVTDNKPKGQYVPKAAGNTPTQQPVVEEEKPKKKKFGFF